MSGLREGTVNCLAELAGRLLRRVCGENRRDDRDSARPGGEHLSDVGGVYPADGEHRRVHGLHDLGEMPHPTRRQPRFRGGGVDVAEGYIVCARRHRLSSFFEAMHRGSEEHPVRGDVPRRSGRQALAPEMNAVGSCCEGNIHPVVDEEAGSEISGPGDYLHCVLVESQRRTAILAQLRPVDPAAQSANDRSREVSARLFAVGYEVDLEAVPQIGASSVESGAPKRSHHTAGGAAATPIPLPVSALPSAGASRFRF